jgi:hypothetical protein
MEKDLVIGLAGQMGYTLSDAEREAILENGTQNLTAFLAYSRALEAEDRGDYRAAAQFYAQAVRADPGFQQARDGYSGAQAAPDAQAAGPGDVTVLAGEDIAAPTSELQEPVATAIGATVVDLAPTTIENTTAGTGTQQGTTTTTANPPPPSVITVIGTIRIVFVLP